MVSKHTMELKTAVGPVQAREIADSYTHSHIHIRAYRQTYSHLPAIRDTNSRFEIRSRHVVTDFNFLYSLFHSSTHHAL